MKIKNNYYSLVLNDKNGAIQSFVNSKGKEFIHYTKNRDLFALTFIDEKAQSFVVSGNMAKRVSFETRDNEISIFFTQLNDFNIDVEVILHYSDSPFLYWRMKVKNRSLFHLDKIDFPKVIVPNDLVATGGNGKIFTSMMEGLLVEDIRLRDIFGLGKRTEGQALSWGGKYPGACTMQFSAYYCDKGGLYLAAHDKNWNPKIVEYYGDDGGVKLEFKLYPGTDDTSNFHFDYDMVMGVFDGDWYDAAEIYRKFIEESGLIKLPKLYDNKQMPKWFKESPVIVCYPVRGQVDTKFEESDEYEYYPYTKAIPYMLELQKDLNSSLMPLLMHWEGTAPWAPPYVWPPYGDFENFTQYIHEMHKTGNYVGLYCSGISWTQKSLLIPSYNKEKEYEKEGWASAILVAPDQKSDYTWQFIRYSYELCPACQKTKDVAISELEKIVSNCDVDYIQFFDQNLGGGTYACYGKKHGHCFGPGKWKNEEMLKIVDKMYELLEKEGKKDKVLIGCEGNAAEPFINRFVFNDSRHNINYGYGYPVPAYNYIFHEYVSNFMGNQNTSCGFVDFKMNPENIYYRYAHSFAQGDVLTVVLKDKGKIHWDWCTPWDAPEIDQKEIRTFIRLLNDWRKGVGKEALQFGRMIKPFPYECGIYHEKMKDIGEHRYPSVECTCYQTKEGKKQQFLVNYLPYEQSVQIGGREKFIVFVDSNGQTTYYLNEENRKIVLQPRSICMIELE